MVSPRDARWRSDDSPIAPSTSPCRARTYAHHSPILNRIINRARLDWRFPNGCIVLVRALRCSAVTVCTPVLHTYVRARAAFEPGVARPWLGRKEAVSAFIYSRGKEAVSAFIYSRVIPAVRVTFGTPVDIRRVGTGRAERPNRQRQGADQQRREKPGYNAVESLHDLSPEKERTTSSTTTRGFL
jgi:hypothetical protein